MKQRAPELKPIQWRRRWLVRVPLVRMLSGQTLQLLELQLCFLRQRHAGAGLPEEVLADQEHCALCYAVDRAERGAVLALGRVAADHTRGGVVPRACLRNVVSGQHLQKVWIAGVFELVVRLQPARVAAALVDRGGAERGPGVLLVASHPVAGAQAFEVGCHGCCWVVVVVVVAGLLVVGCCCCCCANDGGEPARLCNRSLREQSDKIDNALI